jgi:hypothetical protein
MAPYLEKMAPPFGKNGPKKGKNIHSWGQFLAKFFVSRLFLGQIFPLWGHFWPNFSLRGYFWDKFSPDRKKFSFFPLILKKFSNWPPPWKISGYGLEKK